MFTTQALLHSRIRTRKMSFLYENLVKINVKYEKKCFLKNEEVNEILQSYNEFLKTKKCDLTLYKEIYKSILILNKCKKVTNEMAIKIIVSFCERLLKNDIGKELMEDCLSIIDKRMTVVKDEDTKLLYRKFEEKRNKAERFINKIVSFSDKENMLQGNNLGKLTGKYDMHNKKQDLERILVDTNVINTIRNDCGLIQKHKTREAQSLKTTSNTLSYSQENKQTPNLCNEKTMANIMMYNAKNTDSKETSANCKFTRKQETTECEKEGFYVVFFDFIDKLQTKEDIFVQLLNKQCLEMEYEAPFFCSEDVSNNIYAVKGLTSELKTNVAHTLELCTCNLQLRNTRPHKNLLLCLKNSLHFYINGDFRQTKSILRKNIANWSKACFKTSLFAYFYIIQSHIFLAEYLEAKYYIKKITAIIQNRVSQANAVYNYKIVLHFFDRLQRFLDSLTKCKSIDTLLEKACSECAKETHAAVNSYKCEGEDFVESGDCKDADIHNKQINCGPIDSPILAGYLNAGTQPNKSACHSLQNHPQTNAEKDALLFYAYFYTYYLSKFITNENAFSRINEPQTFDTHQDSCTIKKLWNKSIVNPDPQVKNDDKEHNNKVYAPKKMLCNNKYPISFNNEFVFNIEHFNSNKKLYVNILLNSSFTTTRELRVFDFCDQKLANDTNDMIRECLEKYRDYTFVSFFISNDKLAFTIYNYVDCSDYMTYNKKISNESTKEEPETKRRKPTDVSVNEMNNFDNLSFEPSFCDNDYFNVECKRFERHITKPKKFAKKDFSSKTIVTEVICSETKTKFDKIILESKNTMLRNVKTTKDKVEWWKDRHKLDNALKSLCEEVNKCFTQSLTQVFSDKTMSDSSKMNGNDVDEDGGICDTVHSKEIMQNDSATNFTHKKNANKEDSTGYQNAKSLSARHLKPKIFIITDENTTFFPVEMLEELSNKICYRLPSFEWLHKKIITSKRVKPYDSEQSNNYKQPKTHKKSINIEHFEFAQHKNLQNNRSEMPDNVDYHECESKQNRLKLEDSIFYVLDPENNLESTRNTIQTMFSRYTNHLQLKNKDTIAEQKHCCKGVIGRCLTDEEWEHAYKTRYFMYFGHGNGEKFVSRERIRQMTNETIFLFGCSSSKTSSHQNFKRNGVCLEYLKRCNNFLGCLWDVTDKDLDKFSVLLLEHLLYGNKEEIGILVQKYRKRMKMRYLNGGSIVLWGIP